MSLSVAEKYIQAFEHLAKEGNTLILPSNTGDVSSMVAQVTADVGVVVVTTGNCVILSNNGWVYFTTS